METNDWAGLREPWERLRWARIYWQRKIGSAETVRAAAESLGEKEGTYAAYERPPDSSKHTVLDHQRAIQFGNKFKINWIWILTGDETPFDRTPAQKRALELLALADENTQDEAVDIMAAVLNRRTGS
jgi:hypothetical protein